MLNAVIEVDTLLQIQNAYEQLELVPGINIIKINFYCWQAMKCINLSFIYKDNIIGEVEIRVRG